MLERTGVIDMIAQVDGRPELSIVDAAITSNPTARRKLFKAKLQTYVAAIMSGQLKDVPDPRQASIRIVCPDNAAAVFGEIVAIEITPAAGAPFRIPVSLDHFEARF
jgi:hypothetical protein